MKRIIITLFVCFLAFGTNLLQAQLGIKAGFNIANMSSKFDGEKDDTEARLGFHMGVVYGLELTDALDLEIGALLSQKGSKVDFLGSGVKTRLNYLDIPITAKYIIDLNSLGIYIQAGPTVSLGLTGKTKLDVLGVSEKEDIEWGSDEDDELKRLDMSFLVGAGVVLKENLHLGLAANTGLLNVASDDLDGDYKVKNHFFQITATYFLGK